MMARTANFGGEVTFQPVREVSGHDNSQPEARRRQKNREKRGRGAAAVVVVVERRDSEHKSE